MLLGEFKMGSLVLLGSKFSRERRGRRPGLSSDDMDDQLQYCPTFSAESSYCGWHSNWRGSGRHTQRSGGRRQRTIICDGGKQTAEREGVAPPSLVSLSEPVFGTRTNVAGLFYSSTFFFSPIVHFFCV